MSGPPRGAEGLGASECAEMAPGLGDWRQRLWRVVAGAGSGAPKGHKDAR